MLQNAWKIPLIAGAALMLAMNTAPLSMADEWEEHTPYYEDDAWYDISEWFDGNDYNPTDEVLGKWDNETYDSDVPNTDVDNDVGYGYYGDSDWYYDYSYDPYTNYYDYDLDNDIYDYAVHYYDYDHDGVYDAYTSYSDWDGDGVYEDINYYSFDDAASTAQSNLAQKSGNQQDSQRKQLSGSVKQTKDVDVRDSKHLVAQLSTNKGTIAVDLGRKEAADQWNISTGSQLKVRGALAKVGDKQVLVADQVQVGDGEMKDIDRSQAKIEGTIASTKKVKVRGTEHQLAIIDLKNKDSQLMVDLGPSEAFNADLKEDADLTVKGVPIRIKGKAAFLADSVDLNGKTMDIKRRENKSQSANEGST